MASANFPLDARRAAFEILQRVEQGAYADLALDTLLRRNRGTDVRDRALLTELVYGILRLRGRLDHALDTNILAKARLPGTIILKMIIPCQRLVTARTKKTKFHSIVIRPKASIFSRRTG